MIDRKELFVKSCLNQLYRLLGLRNFWPVAALIEGELKKNLGSEKDGKKKKRENPNISKRAEIVKQVMKEQGLGMIQASQYIKKNNLY